MNVTVIGCVNSQNPASLRALAVQFDTMAKQLRSAAEAFESLDKNPAYVFLTRGKSVTMPHARDAYVRLVACPTRRMTARRAAELHLQICPNAEDTLEGIFVAIHRLGASIQDLAILSTLLSHRKETFRNVSKGRWALTNPPPKPKLLDFCQALPA